MDGAVAPRLAGNEGRACVGARRAASLARAARLGVPGKPNAYEIPCHAAGRHGLSESACKAAVRLCVRVPRRIVCRTSKMPS